MICFGEGELCVGVGVEVGVVFVGVGGECDVEFVFFVDMDYVCVIWVV